MTPPTPHDSPPRHIVLLPGMHGTGELFSQFLLKMPTGFRATVLELPEQSVEKGVLLGTSADSAARNKVAATCLPPFSTGCEEPLGYSDLERLLEPRIPGDVPFVLLGESFSGPLAIRLAAKRPPNLRGLILCNSFVSPPRAPLWKMLPWTTLFRIPPPNLLLRRYLTGNDAPASLLADLRRALSRVPPQILASRLRTALTENAREALGQCVVPMLYLRGTQDRLVPPRASRTIEKIAPSTRRCDISGPHLLLQVHPTEAWQAITDFVATVGTA